MAMRGILILVWSGVCVAASAADHHVAATGSDSTGTGSSGQPYASVAKALGEAVSGDTVRLRRGDVFRESGLSVPNNVTVTAYGSGDRPALHGSAVVGGWSDWGSNPAVKTAATDPGDDVVAVYVNGVRMTLARFPNNGWLRCDAGSGNNRIVDAAVSHAAGRWTGAQVRWRKWSWWHETRPITGDNGSGTLTLGGSAALNNTGIESGYYIDDDLDELDAAGEWYWDGSTLYLYPPAGVGLGSATVEVAYAASALSVGAATIQDIAFRHYVDRALGINGTATISGCAFEDLPRNGISGSWNAGGSLIAGCTFSDILNNGITWNENPGGSTGTVFEDNGLSAIGTVPGLDAHGVWSGVGILVSNANGLVVRRNRIEGTGYAGILFGSDGCTAERNVLIGCMATENDGAAIYCNASANVIRENIIIATEGDLDSSHPWTPLGHGIWVEFLSEFSDSVIEHNTVFGCGGAGLFLNNNFDCTIAGNRFVSNQNGGIQLGPRNDASSTNHRHDFDDNILAIGAVGFSTSQPRNLESWAETHPRCLSYDPTDGDGRNIDYGSMAGTDFLTPDGDDYVRVDRWQPTKTIATWQSEEANWADPSPRVTTADGYLFINDSNATVDLALPGGVTWEHLDGSSAGSSVNLAPFRSAVLIAASGDASGVPGYTFHSDAARPVRSITIGVGGVDGWSIESDNPWAIDPGPDLNDPATFTGLDAGDGHRLSPTIAADG